MESLLPEDKRAVLVVNALQKYLLLGRTQMLAVHSDFPAAAPGPSKPCARLRPFTFFFSGGEEVLPSLGLEAVKPETVQFS